MEQSKFYQIKNITEQEYTLVGCDGSVITRPILDVDKSASAFTIRDAKDGDVLICKGNIKNSNGIKYERICLFNNLNNAFFTLTKTSNFVEEYDIDVNIDYPDNTVPATKEQKEILFMAMKEAGYIWDAEKKELKKISQRMISAEAKEAMYDKPAAWSEDDKVGLGDALWAIEQAKTIAKDENDMGNLWCAEKWLKSLQGRVQSKQEWSEENEPQKELAKSYLAKFDEKFPILPTLKGKQLADYKNFLNKCQQIFRLKYWGIRPIQAKLFEKLSLLWAAWGAEHLQGLEQTDGNMDNEMSMWSEEDERMFNSCCAAVAAADYYTLDDKQDMENWLKSLKDRVGCEANCTTTKEWSEEEIEKAAQEWDSKANFNPFYMTMENGKPTGVKQSITTHKESFKAGVNWILKYGVQPKQEWSEEDENRFNNLIFLVECSDENEPTKKGFINFINRLKSLRPQNNITDEELTQAKKNAYNDALDKIEYHSGEPTFDDGWSAAIDYIQKKSIRPQNRWKPSDGDIIILEKVIKGELEPKIFQATLQGILEQLKKLKEGKV